MGGTPNASTGPTNSTTGVEEHRRLLRLVLMCVYVRGIGWVLQSRLGNESSSGRLKVQMFGLVVPDCLSHQSLPRVTVRRSLVQFHQCLRN